MSKQTLDCCSFLQRSVDVCGRDRQLPLPSLPSFAAKGAKGLVYSRERVRCTIYLFEKAARLGAAAKRGSGEAATSVRPTPRSDAEDGLFFKSVPVPSSIFFFFLCV